jgi:xylan 1,4-beta-xylosidase
MRKLLPVTCLLSILGGSAAIAAPREICVDVRQEQGPVNRMFNLCVGAGRANEGLRADWQKQLALIKKECGFRYLRMHGLLCDDMGVYREDKNGRPVYNWQYIDPLYDAMLDMGIKPFVELSFMPQALASGSQTLFWWKGNVTPPKDYEKWNGLIRALVQHWVERYGEAEVASWYFEVWNEPNLKGAFFTGDQADYFKMYENTARTIKAISPKFRVGGPATAGNAWIPETIAFCEQSKAPIDFIATHHYAVTAGYLDETGNAGTVLSPDVQAMYREIRHSREQIAASTKPNLELHYTEWSASYTPSDPVHDSYHSAAFIIDKIRNTGSAAQSMSYWTFTDIFEEAGPRATPFHGGFGLLNMQGIPKASFYAYQFLNRLGDRELKSSDPASWITKQGNAVQALFWDFTITHPGPSVNNQEFYLRDLPAKAKDPVKLEMKGLKPGNYALTVYQVGYRVNDAFATYKDLGSPAQLTREQVKKICSQNDGKPITTAKVIVGKDGVFSRNFPFRENDVFLVELKPVHSAK